MRENKIRTIWGEGGVVLNGWLQIPSAYSAEMMAHQGWDSLTIDIQHGPVDYQVAVSMLQAISTTATIPLARLPWNEPGIIMKLLDAGCYGLICPMVNSRAEAEAFVGACRYPPQGYRSHGPNRALLYAGSDYAYQANETIITMAMIETEEALDNLDEILRVPGLDAIYVGPADLSRSLTGKSEVNFEAAPLAPALDKIIAATKKHGVVPGLHVGSPEQALQLAEKGFQFTTIGSDARLMKGGASQVITAFREGDQSRQQTEQSGLY